MLVRVQRAGRTLSIHSDGSLSSSLFTFILGAKVNIYFKVVKSYPLFLHTNLWLY